MKQFFLIGLAAGTAMAGAATSAAAFDSRDPTEVMSVIATNGASGQLKKDDKGQPYIDAKAGPLTFEVDFFGCDNQGVSCATTIYTTGWNMTSVTLDQVNRWNRWTALCPAYLNGDNHPHAWYGLKPSINETRDDVVNQMNAWLDCLSDFDKFTDAPEDFLKQHGE